MPVGVGVVARDRHGQLLLGLRDKPGEPATWCLPGGSVDPGESFEQAALRELTEETGLTADTVEVVALGVGTEGGHNVTVAVVAHGLRGEPELLAPHEFASLHWFRAEALPEPLFPPTRLVLDRVTERDSEHAVATCSLRQR